MDEDSVCPICANANVATAALGNVIHTNCRYCGAWYFIVNTEAN